MFTLLSGSSWSILELNKLCFEIKLFIEAYDIFEVDCALLILMVAVWGLENPVDDS